MGTTELSATRVRNQKRRQSRKRRNDARASNEHGGVMVKTLVTKDMTEKDIMKVWVDEFDVGAPNGGYTDEKWRAECEERRMAMRVKELNKEILEEVERVGQTSDEYYADLRAKAESRVFINKDKANARQIGGDHYKNMGVEPWDVVDTWPIEQQIGAYRHGALKYLMRMGSKDEQIQEIKKAGHYIEKLIEVLESEYGSKE